MTLGDINVLIAAASLFIGALGGAFAFWRWVVGTLRAVEAENKTTSVLLDAKLELLRAKQAEFELEVAKHYASDDRLREMEAKFTASFDKLINRFDAFATDFNRIVGRMERLDKERAEGR